MTMHDHSVSIYDYTDHSMLWKKKLLWPNEVCHCIDLHHMCGAVSLPFFLKHKIFQIAGFPSGCFRDKMQGAKDQKGITTGAPGHPNVQGIPIPRHLPQCGTCRCGWGISIPAQWKIHPFVSTEWETLQICGILSIYLHAYTCIFIQIIYTYIQMNVWGTWTHLDLLFQPSSLHLKSVQWKTTPWFQWHKSHHVASPVHPSSMKAVLQKACDELNVWPMRGKGNALAQNDQLEGYLIYPSRPLPCYSCISERRNTP